MENQATVSHQTNIETQMSNSCFSKDFDLDTDLKESTSAFPNCYRSPGICKDDFVMFRCGASKEEVPILKPNSCFEGGCFAVQMTSCGDNKKRKAESELDGGGLNKKRKGESESDGGGLNKKRKAEDGGGLIPSLVLSKKRKKNKAESDGSKNPDSNTVHGSKNPNSTTVPKYSDMVRRNSAAGSSGNPGKELRSNSAAGSSGNPGKELSDKSTASMRVLTWMKANLVSKLKFTLAYQWTRGFYLQLESGRQKIALGEIPQDWLLHGLWPPDEAASSSIEFNEQEILRNRVFLDKLLENWASLECEYEDMGGHFRFWRGQWNNHGKKSRLPQQLYMELALELYSKYKDQLIEAMDLAKARASATKLLGVEVATIDTGLFNTAVGYRLAEPQLRWYNVEDNVVLKEVQIQISFSSDGHTAVEDMMATPFPGHMIV